MIDFCLIFGASAALVASYITVIKNASTTMGYVPMVTTSATVGLSTGVMRVTLSAGETLKLQSTITGTSPTLLINDSSITISSVD